MRNCITFLGLNERLRTKEMVHSWFQRDQVAHLGETTNQPEPQQIYSLSHEKIRGTDTNFTHSTWMNFIYTWHPTLHCSLWEVGPQVELFQTNQLAVLQHQPACGTEIRSHKTRSPEPSCKGSDLVLPGFPPSTEGEDGALKGPEQDGAAYAAEHAWHGARDYIRSLHSGAPLVEYGRSNEPDWTNIMRWSRMNKYDPIDTTAVKWTTISVGWNNVFFS